MDTHNVLTQLSIGEAIGIAGTIGVLVMLVRRVHPVIRRINDFLDDWLGEPPRPGVTGRLGVMARLSSQDEAIEDVRGHLVRHIRESKAWVGELDRRAAERDFDVPPWPTLPEEDDWCE